MNARRRTGRTIHAAFAFSLLFHLSMITVFRIVVLIPPSGLSFIGFRIVDPGRDRGGASNTLRLASSESAFDRMAAEESARDDDDRRWARLPAIDIELPTVEFDELEILRARSKGLEVGKQYSQVFEDGADDSWARFGRQMDSVGEALMRTTQDLLGIEPEGRTPVGSPAPGFETYIEWLDGPIHRLPIALIKIEALRGVNPDHLRQPISLSFEVNRAGKVAKVIPQGEDEQGFTEAAATALFRCAFEPAGTDAPEFQQGMMIVVVEGTAP